MATQHQIGITTKKQLAFLDRAYFKGLFDEANQIALTKAGVRIRDAAKKGIGNAAPSKPSKVAKKVQLAGLQEIDGGLYKDISLNKAGGKPRQPGKPVKSWAPKRWIYRDIKYYWDRGGGGSVVIGPYRTPWLMRLHEFGGTERLNAWTLASKAAERAKAARDRGGRIPRFADGGLQVGYVRWEAKGFKGMRVRGRITAWTKTGMSKSVRYPARPFMQGSAYVVKALAKVPLDFKDTLKGTSTGGIRAA